MDSFSHKYSISAILKVLEIPRSAIYYKNKEKLPNIRLESEVLRIFRESRSNYGARKIKIELDKLNIITSRRKIRQIMQKYHLVSTYIKNRPKTKRTSCNEDNCPNILNREFNRDNTLDVVVSDLTYVKVASSWNYVCLIVDLWNREIVGFAAGKHKDAELVYEAFESIPYPLDRINIFHTDRGSEFKNQIIDEVIEKYNLKRSLSNKGTPLDNAVIEATNHILKTEFIYQHKFNSLIELQLLLADYVHWYNYKRIHGSIGYLSPIEYRRKHGEQYFANDLPNILPLVFLQNASGMQNSKTVLQQQPMSLKNCCKKC